MQLMQQRPLSLTGFYEWKTLKDGQKQPYLVFAPQPKGLKIQDMAKFDASAYDDKKGWQVRRELWVIVQ